MGIFWDKQLLPFRGRFHSKDVIRSGELELGRSFIDPLQSFPDTAHLEITSSHTNKLWLFSDCNSLLLAGISSTPGLHLRTSSCCDYSLLAPHHLFAHKCDVVVIRQKLNHGLAKKTLAHCFSINSRFTLDLLLKHAWFRLRKAHGTLIIAHGQFFRPRARIHCFWGIFCDFLRFEQLTLPVTLCATETVWGHCFWY